MAKRTKKDPLHRGQLCRLARSLHETTDKVIRDLRWRILDLQRYRSVIEHVQRAGQLAVIEEQNPDLFGGTHPDAERMVEELDDELAALRRKLKRYRSHRRRVIQCRHCEPRGSGRRFGKACGRCHGQGYFPKGFGF